MKTKKNKKLEPKIFLTDKAVGEANSDEFDHLSYSILLEKIIRNQETPYNIGIYGKWGVGKSTIVNLLLERLRNGANANNFKFIEIKVWKYDKKSLKRKFILRIAEELKLDLDDLHSKIYYDQETETALINIKEIWTTIFDLKNYPIWILVISVVVFLVVKVLNIMELSFPLFPSLFKVIEETISIPILGSLVFWIVSILNKAKVKIKVGKYDSDEQFENEFIKLIQKDPNRKIIFIDDLDRCSGEKVITTLETIKTFLDVETCVFVIACDDEIIRDAINRTEIYKLRTKNEGAEYLEKFFQYTITVPPFMIPDMRKYIKNILYKDNNFLIRLPETEIEDIIFVLINSFVKNPRNAKVVLNEFISCYKIAEQREVDKEGKMHENVITKNLKVLAVTVSLKNHFPNFYQDLMLNPDLLFAFIKMSNKNLEECTQKEINYLSNYFEQPLKEYTPRDQESRDLLLYIESVREFVTVSDLVPFLYLVIDSNSYLVGDEYLQDLSNALKDGIESKVDKILSTADSKKLGHIFQNVSDWIENRLEGTERRKALQVLSKNLTKCPTEKLKIVSGTFFRKLNKSMAYEEYKNYDMHGMFICLSNISAHWQNQLLNSLLQLLAYKDTEFEKELLSHIYKNNHLISKKKPY